MTRIGQSLPRDITAPDLSKRTLTTTRQPPCLLFRLCVKYKYNATPDPMFYRTLPSLSTDGSSFFRHSARTTARFLLHAQHKWQGLVILVRSARSGDESPLRRLRSPGSPAWRRRSRRGRARQHAAAPTVSTRQLLGAWSHGETRAYSKSPLG